MHNTAELMGRILITGGDGFVGWPTALRLSRAGHQVCVVDNFSRRRIGDQVFASSVVPIATLEERVQSWKETTGFDLQYIVLDVAQDPQGVRRAIESFKPTAICHFAHQRSAPYSMLSDATKRYTVDNNVQSTLNVLLAIKAIDPSIHLVHMGTMGVYGYSDEPGGSIPEGYLTVYDQEGQSKSIVHPYHPGSIYHLTKCMVNTMFHFFAKNDRLRITELHQGIIWGAQTPDTLLHPKLSNRVDVDGEYGTVLNRFAVQCALKQPMTVYGTGGQTRAFIHIVDSTRCTEIALAHPPAAGDPVETFNQATQCMRLRDLASMLTQVVPGSTIVNVPNPRKEKQENDLSVEGTVALPGKFAQIGLNSQVLINTASLSDVVQMLRCSNLDSVSMRSSAKW